MPKIFGTNLLGILAATIVFYLLGFLWYGMIFDEMWLAFNGISEAEALAQAENMGAMMYVGGIVITLMQVLGLAYILHHASASVVLTCVKICAIIAVLIALPLMLYAHIYEGRSHQAILLDFAHILIGYILVGAVLSFFRGKDAIGD
jgi:Sec-independent protein secretion pathway component TatC